MPPLNAEGALKQAIARNPSTIAKQLRGQTPKRAAKPKFQAYTVSQLLETYRDPRAVLLEIASMDVDKLMTLAKCTPLEAVQERRLCALNVLPYVAQKLPVQVDMRHTRAIHLNIVDATHYQELQQIAQGDEAMAMQLVTGAVVESALIASEVEDAATDGTGVRPAAVADAPQVADSAIVDKDAV